MKVNARICWLVAVLTSVTSVTPLQELVAADPSGSAEQLGRSPLPPAVSDVELAPGGTLSGQIINSTGQSLVQQAVLAQQANREPIATHTDQQGRFQMSGLNAGLCQISFGEDAVACRCWSPRTAPPVAAKELLLTSGESVVRGQRPLADLFCGPILIGMIIGAAIAIPIAIHNSKKDAS